MPRWQLVLAMECSRSAQKVSVAMAAGLHPFPFRTRKLSPPAPMVLGPKGPGRVGRRRTYLREGRPTCVGRPSFVFGAFRRTVGSRTTSGTSSQTGWHERSSEATKGCAGERARLRGAALTEELREVREAGIGAREVLAEAGRRGPEGPAEGAVGRARVEAATRPPRGRRRSAELGRGRARASHAT